MRVLVGGALGFASGTDLDPVGRADLAEQAVHLARASAPDPARMLPDPAPVARRRPGGIFDPALARAAIGRGGGLADADRAGRLRRRLAIDVAHIERYGQVVERVAVANSRGVALSTAATLCYLSLSVIAREDGDAERGYGSMIGRGRWRQSIRKTSGTARGVGR